MPSGYAEIALCPEAHSLARRACITTAGFSVAYGRTAIARRAKGDQQPRSWLWNGCFGVAPVGNVMVPPGTAGGSSESDKGKIASAEGGIQVDRKAQQGSAGRAGSAVSSLCSK